MKKTILIAGLLLVGCGAYAQGTVVFNNRVPAASPAINAPVFGTDGTTKLLGTQFVAEMWAGSSAGSLVAVGPTIQFYGTSVPNGAGYLNEGTDTPAGNGGARTINSVAPGGTAFIQVRAWDTTTGASYATATTHGESTIFQVVTGGNGSPPALPTALQGLTSFQLNAVPEPSVLALGALGAAALLIRRRSNK